MIDCCNQLFSNFTSGEDNNDEEADNQSEASNQADNVEEEEATAEESNQYQGVEQDIPIVATMTTATKPTTGAPSLSREFRERFRELLRLARSGISEFLAGAPEFRRSGQEFQCTVQKLHTHRNKNYSGT
jgi:hypothetical protein